MTARWYIADVNGTFSEVTGRVPREGWEIREQAEEGSGAMSTVTFDDPDMTWDPEPWRNWYLLEDTSEDANSMLCGGWTAEQEVGREGGEVQNPLGRAWSLALTDANTYWQMRVMVGSDANRPAETDVARVQWLLATNELAWALDVTTYVQTTTPVNMDACDYRGQMVNQIMDDAAQASGKNWYAWIDYVASVRTVTVWYGKDSWEERDSALSLSNDPADWDDDELADGTSLVWPISYDTKLNRDPSRMYDGCYLTYDGGAVYRDLDPRTVRRDFIAPSFNVKSSTKAIARANRYLGELDEQNLVVTTTVELPAAKATMIRAGMRLQLKALHLPSLEAFTWCRVLSCAVAPAAAGERYRLTLELQPVEALTPVVKWIFLFPYGNDTDEFTIQASDDGDTWSTILTGAQLKAGTVNPPNVSPVTVEGLVEVPEDDWRHRYWRLSHVNVFGGGYYPGISIKYIRLLSGSDWDAADRAGGVTADPPLSWWSTVSGGCGKDAEPPCWVTTPEYAAVTNAGSGLYGTFSGTCDLVTSRGGSYTGRSGCEFGVRTGVLGAATITSTWTWDLGEG